MGHQNTRIHRPIIHQHIPLPKKHQLLTKELHFSQIPQLIIKPIHKHFWTSGALFPLNHQLHYINIRFFRFNDREHHLHNIVLDCQLMELLTIRDFEHVDGRVGAVLEFY